MRRPGDDADLWNAYWAATDTDTRKKCAGIIVEHHLGFIKQYAMSTAFNGWDRTMRDAYVHELVIVALERVARFDPSLASFPTYLRRSYMPVRWKLAAREDGDFSTGYETERLRVGARAFTGAFTADNGRPPTEAEVCEHLSKVHGKNVSPGRLAGVLPPSVTSGDRLTADDDGGRTVFDGVPAIGSDPAADVEERLAADAASELVADLLDAVPLTDLEKAILVERLMAPPREVVDGEKVHPGPTPLHVIAGRFGMKPADVRAAETDLLDRFREALS